MSLVATAAGLLARLVAKPLTDAAMRREEVLRVLKAVKLDPRRPPRDFDSIYTIALIEYCNDRSASVLAVFRNTYVLDAFRRSFHDHDWTRLRREITDAVERNRETGEFGHLDHGFDEHVDGFVTAFDSVLNNSRTPHEIRSDAKLDALLEQAGRTRDEEERHRLHIEPARSRLTPAQRLAQDATEWFRAVGYGIHHEWPAPDGSVALLVDIPRLRPGQFDRMLMLCVEGELGPHHLNLLAELTEQHRAAEGWGIARLRVSAAARELADRSEDRLYAYAFDDLIDLVADFEPYLAWVEEEVRRRGIDTRYVPLSCEKAEIDPATGQPLATSRYDWKSGGLDDYVARWLDEPAKQHLSVLGEFGMGKSWFALHLAYTMVQAWRDAKRRGVPRPRIPLLIPLRDYAKQTTVQGLLAEFFFNKHKVNLGSSDVVRVLNRMGRLLLIFDGFDEMAARTDRHTVVANFWELATVVEPGSKVLLSSRKEHFRHAQEARELFSAKVGLPRAGTALDGPVFDIVDLVPFDDEQVEMLLSFGLDEPQVRMVMNHPDVRELMRRPVMSELVIDALPEIEQGAEIDLARIYLYAISRKMDRDIHAERTFTSRADKLYFLCEVAWKMLSEQKLSLNYRDFPEHLRSCFGSVVESAKDLDYWEQDMRNQGMFVRDAEGNYGPSHKSLLEFLVAFKFAGELGLLIDDFLAAVQPAEQPSDGVEAEWTWSDYFASRSPEGALPALGRFVPEPVELLGKTLGHMPAEAAVLHFLSSIVRSRPAHQNRLLDVARATEDTKLHSPSWLAANCLNLLLATGHSLAGLDLSGLDLEGLGNGYSDLTLSLAGADLRSTLIEGVRAHSTDLSGADLREARISDTSVLGDEDVSGPYVCGLMNSDGALMIAAISGALLWPDGQIASTPSSVPAHARLDTQLQRWDADTFRAGRRLVDLRTGTITATTRSPAPALAVQGSRHVLLTFSDSPVPRFILTDPETGQSAGELVLPLGEDDNYTTIPGSGHLCLLAVTQDSLRFLTADPAPSGGWRPVEIASTAGKPYSRIGLTLGAESALLYFDGTPVAAADSTTASALLDPDGLSLPFGEDIEQFVFRAASGMAAAALADHRLCGWQPGSPATEPSWEVGVPALGIQALFAPPSGDRLAVLTRLGELWLLDFRTGEMLDHAALTDRLRGARFSRGCGLDDATLDAIVRLGGLVSD
ncbi:NACHT domain-containing protein [Kitasatospora sp. NPDC004615]|uniref:NACHT domain-containing protein n=1 Tax=Kitasatospora sp. NPDC004615 TaxID=3364017 RepID=UPI00369DA69D